MIRQLASGFVNISPKKTVVFLLLHVDIFGRNTRFVFLLKGSMHIRINALMDLDQIQFLTH